MKRRMMVAAMAAALAIPLTASTQPYGYGMGPGMMVGGYGPGYGMGPDMMGGGYGRGYGMGPGMMGGGYGPGYGMGPDMMGGCGAFEAAGLDLTPEQRQKLTDIQRDMFDKRWQLMGKMHAADGPMSKAWAGGEVDEKAARQAYDEMAKAHKEMFEAQMEARKRVQAVLTPEQRKQLEQGYAGRWSRR